MVLDCQVGNNRFLILRDQFFSCLVSFGNEGNTVPQNVLVKREKLAPLDCHNLVRKLNNDSCRWVGEENGDNHSLTELVRNKFVLNAELIYSTLPPKQELPAEYGQEAYPTVPQCMKSRDLADHRNSSQANSVGLHISWSLNGSRL